MMDESRRGICRRLSSCLAGCSTGKRSACCSRRLGIALGLWWRTDLLIGCHSESGEIRIRRCPSTDGSWFASSRSHLWSSAALEAAAADAQDTWLLGLYPICLCTSANAIKFSWYWILWNKYNISTFWSSYHSSTMCSAANWRHPP